jgi:hypothetical protein
VPAIRHPAQRGAQDTLGILAGHRTEPEVAVNQGQMTEILPTAPQQIEGNEAWLPTVEQQVIEP